MVLFSSRLSEKQGTAVASHLPCVFYAILNAKSADCFQKNPDYVLFSSLYAQVLVVFSHSMDQCSSQNKDRFIENGSN